MWIFINICGSCNYIDQNVCIFVAVLNELEGLARGADSRDCPPASRATLDPEHVARVAESAKAALAFARSRNPAIRCLTTRGTVLTSSTFTVEEDVDKVSELISCKLKKRNSNKQTQRETFELDFFENCVSRSGYRSSFWDVQRVVKLRQLFKTTYILYIIYHKYTYLYIIINEPSKFLGISFFILRRTKGR